MTRFLARLLFSVAVLLCAVGLSDAHADAHAAEAMSPAGPTTMVAGSSGHETHSAPATPAGQGEHAAVHGSTCMPAAESAPFVVAVPGDLGSALLAAEPAVRLACGSSVPSQLARPPDLTVLGIART